MHFRSLRYSKCSGPAGVLIAVNMHYAKFTLWTPKLQIQANTLARCHRITLFDTFYPYLRIHNVHSYLYKLLLILIQSYAQSMTYSHGTCVLLEVLKFN